MSERLSRLTPADLDDAQLQVYNAITLGARAEGTQHFPLAAGDGSLNGPFGAMLHSPDIGAALEQLGSTIRFGTGLSPRCREIAILQVAHATASHFEWWAHEPIGRAAGLTDDELAALSTGSFRSSDPLEAAVASFCAGLLSSVVLTDDEVERMSATLGDQHLIDLTVLIGHYRMLAQLMGVFDIGVPAGEARR